MNEQTIRILVLVIIALICILRIKKGYNKGFQKEVGALFAVFAVIVGIIVILMAYGAYKAGTYWTFLIAILVLVALGLVYKVGALILSPLSGLLKIDLFCAIDKLLGAVTGAAEAIVLVVGIDKIMRFFELGSILWWIDQLPF